jgi:hypothetical protein
MKVVLCVASAMAAVFISAGSAGASTFSFGVTSTDTAGDPISALAVITLSAGGLSLDLENLQLNPKDAGQVISAINITLNGATISASFNGAQPETLVSIAGNKTFATSSGTLAGWSSSHAGSVVSLTTSNTDTIIGGPGGLTYSNANGSIAGNGPHNPFIFEDGLFNLLVGGVTANSIVSGVTINFGTATDLVTAQLQPTPVPAALPLFAGGLGLMGFLARRKKRKALGLLAAPVMVPNL